MSQARQTPGRQCSSHVENTGIIVVLRRRATQSLVMLSSLANKACLECLRHGSTLASRWYRQSWLPVGDGGCSDC